MALTSVNANYGVYAQESDLSALAELVKNNHEEVEALSLYPEDIRMAILETSLHPELLVKLGAIQTKTSQSFNAILENLPEDDQKKYWELIRYDNLIERIVEGGPKPRGEIENIARDYPEEIRETAVELGSSQYNTLVKINDINKNASEASLLLLANSTPEVQENVKLLLQFPEVLHILTSNLDLTILVGEAYKENPEMVIRKADSINLAASQRYAREINEWKEGLNDDPEALEEFEKVSNEFKNENGYEDNDPMYPNTAKPDKKEAQQELPQENVRVYYNYYSYPYWYGYPRWFPDTFWYHYPYWYHWGFYYGPHRGIFISGLPSYFFISWYFRYPYHYYRYPYFTDYVIRYYKSGPGPRRSGLGTAVREWQYRNGNEVRERVVRNAGNRDPRLWRDYGRFEEAVAKRRRKSPQVRTNHRQYLDQNSRRYPVLSGNKVSTIRESDRRSSRSRSLNTRTPTRSTRLNRARDVHQRTWERSDYSRRRTVVRPSSTRRSATPTRRSSSSTSRKRKKNK